MNTRSPVVLVTGAPAGTGRATALAHAVDGGFTARQCCAHSPRPTLKP